VDFLDEPQPSIGYSLSSFLICPIFCVKMGHWLVTCGTFKEELDCLLEGVSFTS